MRHLLDKQHVIYSEYRLKAGTLTYHTQGAEHARAAQQARDAKLAFKVTAYKPELKEFVGRVESVALVEGVKPVTWEIVVKTVTPQRST